MKIITIAALALLAACDISSTGTVHDPGVVNCVNVLRGGDVRFDNTDDVSIWQGVSGRSIDVNDQITNTRVKLRFGDGWKCTPPTGNTAML